MKGLRHTVFWPPFLALIVAVAASIFATDSFVDLMRRANHWILEIFGWLFNFVSMAMVLVCAAIYVSPIGKIRIGGPDAKPLLTKWRWFAITICTTIAVGILFWGTAEPLLHLHQPPPIPGLDPNTRKAALFALSTMFLHWTVTPYAIYSVPAIMFAIAYYNSKAPFSLSAPLNPLFNDSPPRAATTFVDSICLYSLVAGMSASLGTGILVLSGGLQSVMGLHQSQWTNAGIALLIVGSFAMSSASGLARGIRILSDLNIKIFFILALFVFIAGPTTFIIKFGGEALIEYLAHFFDWSFRPGGAEGTSWSQDWTVFYWANWMAWAPVTALFLGRLTVGYTVREALRMNLLYPAIFGIIWMSIFGATILHMEMVDGANLNTSMQNGGPESIIYRLFENLPLTRVTSLVFIVTTFLSFVTAADSNTEALGGLSTHGIDARNPEAGVTIKIIWATIIGVISWTMVSHAGITGIKIMSSLGGLPALFLLTAITAGSVKFIWQHSRNPEVGTCDKQQIKKNSQ